MARGRRCNSLAGADVGSSYERAVSLLAQHGGAAAGGAHDYFPQNLMLRLSVKLFDCTPAQLPADLRDQLVGWLQAAPTGQASVWQSPRECAYYPACSTVHRSFCSSRPGRIV